MNNISKFYILQVILKLSDAQPSSLTSRLLSKPNRVLGLVLGFLVTSIYCSNAAVAQTTELNVSNDGFDATFYDSPQQNQSVGIIVLGGSEGGQPKRLAKAFAKEGYSTLAIAYFNAAGTPKHLDEIELEYFDKPIKWFAEQPSMTGKKIVLIGGSKGAELALLLASRKKEITGVIAISPSSVVFQGIPKIFWPPRSSWKSKGKPVPFVPYDISRGINIQNLRPMYELSLSNAEIVAQAMIPVEKINGPILLLSGEDDTMWPASNMADTLINRLKTKKFSNSFEHFKYENAGHTLTEFYIIGGTKEGNKKARIDSKLRINEFLTNNYPQKSP